MTIDLLCELLALICLIAVNATVIWGVHGAAQITGLATKLEGLPTWCRKILYDCPVCQPTFWTIPVMIACGATSRNMTWWAPVIVWLATAGLNFVIKEYLYPEQE